MHAHETHTYEIHALEVHARKGVGEIFRPPTLQAVCGGRRSCPSGPPQYRGLGTSDWKSHTANGSTVIVCWTVSSLPESVCMWRLETVGLTVGCARPLYGPQPVLPARSCSVGGGQGATKLPA